MSDALSLDEVQRRYRARFFLMMLMAAPVSAATWVLLMWRDEEPSVLGQPMTRAVPLALALVATACLVGWRAWRCPACDAHLTSKVHPYRCPSCAIALRVDPRQPRVP